MASKWVSGPVKVGIKPSLPFKGINLLFGNDLAGDKVFIDPSLIDKPCLDQNSDFMEVEIPDLYASCLVTRAMDRVKNYSNENDEDADDINLADWCLAKFFENEKVDSNESDLFESAHFGIEDSENETVFGHRAFVSACTKFLKIYIVCRT